MSFEETKLGGSGGPLTSFPIKVFDRILKQILRIQFNQRLLSALCNILYLMIICSLVVYVRN